MELHVYPYLQDTRQDNDLFAILLWSPRGISLEPFSQTHTFSAFGCHHASHSRRHILDLLTRFSCGHGWLGLHTWWWMIWYHLIFWPTTHLMPYWGLFSFWLRFVNHHWFAWSSSFMRYTLSWLSVFILRWFSGGAFLESFIQARTFWCCRDSWMELSQTHRLPYHQFSGVHVRYLIHSHLVIIKLSR